VKKVFVSVGLFATMTLGLSATAWAAPNPNPNAPHVKPCEDGAQPQPEHGAGRAQFRRLVEATSVMWVRPFAG
jgi:hypothetical protein